MKFVCERCHTRYSIADEKVRQRILRIRCKTCNEVITVRGDGESAGPAAAPRALSVHWFVSIDGSRQGPMSAADAARTLLASGRQQGTYVWKDGFSAWKPSGDVPEIASELNAQRAKGSASPTVPPPPPPPLPRPSSSRAIPAGASRPSLPPPHAAARPPLPVTGRPAVPSKAPALPLPGAGAGKSAHASGLRPESSVSKPSPVPKAAAETPTPAPKAKAETPTPAPKVKAETPTPAPKVKAETPAPESALAHAAAEPVVARPKPTLPPPSGAAHHGPPPLSRPSAKSVPVVPESPTKAGPAGAFDAAPETPKSPVLAKPERGSGVMSASASAAGEPSFSPSSPDSDPLAFLDDEAAEDVRTPPPTRKSPSAVSEAKESGAAVAPLVPVATPTPSVALAGAAAAAPAPVSLFSSVATIPARSTGAESGLSRLTGLPGLVHRYQGLKYIVAGGIIVVLVLVIVVLTWTRDGGKPSTWTKKDTRSARTTSAADEARAREEAERMFRATVGGKDTPASKDSVAQVGPRRAPSHAAPSKPPASSLEPSRLARNQPGAKSPELQAAQRRFESTETAPLVPRAPVVPARTVHEVSQAQISAVVRNKSNQTSLKLCYERALKLGGEVRSGRVDVTVSIGASGVVRNVQVRAPVELSSVEDCIKRAVRRWAFPNNVEEYGTSFPVILQGS